MKFFSLALGAAAVMMPTMLVAKMMPEIGMGASIPANFTARDASGKPRTYASIRGRSGTVLVFTRSAKWCPFCQAQLKDLKGAQAGLAQRGYSLAAISYDEPAVLAGFAKSQGIGYTLLSDKGSKMIDAFGLRDPEYAQGSFAYGVPKATVVVIDAKGKVLKSMVSPNYRTRPTNADILAAVGGR
jgi:peroxiredoxin